MNSTFALAADGTVTVSGAVDHIDQRKTRQENWWVALTVRTATGPATCLILPRTYQAARDYLDALLVVGTPVTVSGRVNDDGDTDIYVTDIRRAA